MATIAAPFEIGQQWWAPRVYPSRITVPCPACCGQLAVTVILGDGDRVGVPCEACGKGYDGPKGTVEEWEHAPGVDVFVITGVSSMHAGRWTVVSETGDSRPFEELRQTEAEAMAESIKRCAEQHERNMQSRQHKRRTVENASWSIQYHRKCIKDLERQIEWHKSRLLKPRAQPPSADAVDPHVGIQER